MRLLAEEVVDVVIVNGQAWFGCHPAPQGTLANGKQLRVIGFSRDQGHKGIRRLRPPPSLHEQARKLQAIIK